ncbi:MAG: sulfite exporter TauE/SafE family protein [Candidatus Thermoplasmatota archaeon]
MTFDFSDFFTFMIFGLGSGLFVGTAAGTAASFLIPALTILIGYTTHQSIGTSLGVDCIIGIIAGLIFIKNKNVDLKSSFLLVISGVLGSFFGSMFTSNAPQGNLNILIGFILVFIGINFLRNGVSKNVEYIEKKISFDFLRKHKIFTLLTLGTIIGMVSGFIGIGGSRMLTIILIFVMGYSLHKAIGTSLVMMFFIAGTGTISHALNEEIVLEGLLILGFFAAIGAFFGSNFANRVNEDRLARIAGLIIFILGLIIIFKSFI